MEQVVASTLEYRKKNAAMLAAKSKAWREANPERFRASKRSTNLMRKYGITVEQYDSYLVLQDGVCAICACPPDGSLLCVDHDHDSGAVRGLLCRPCNLALGSMRDDPERLRAAAAYLEARS